MAIKKMLDPRGQEKKVTSQSRIILLKKFQTLAKQSIHKINII